VARVPSQFRLLGMRRFAPLFATQFLGAFNDNVYKNALIIFITFHAAAGAGKGGAMLVTLSAGIFILPFFLFSATAGQLADRLEKSALIRRIKLAEIGIMVLGAAGFFLGSVPLLVGVLFLMGAQSTAFGPLKYGILPQHLGEHELTGGNGLVQMGTFLAILLGTMLGGVLAADEQRGSLLVSGAVLLFASGGWLASRGIPRAGAADPKLEVDWNVARATLRILAHARAERSVFYSIIGISWFWFVGGTFLQLLPSYTRDVLGGGPYVVTLMLTAFSVGIGLGSLACNGLSRGRVEIGIVPIGALGLAVFSGAIRFVEPGLAMGAATMPEVGVVAFLSHAENRWVVGVFLALALAGGVYIVPLYALVQSRSAPAHRARTIAANNVLNALFMVLSAAMTMTLLALGLSISDIFFVTAVLTLLVAAVVFARAPEFVQRLCRWAGLRREPPAAQGR